LTIDFVPDNRDVYRTLDGAGLFGLRFENGTSGWCIHAEYLPRELTSTLPGEGAQDVRLQLPAPVYDFHKAKSCAAQWAEQAWREHRLPAAAPDDATNPWLEEEKSA
jgi:hypothetical protein